MSFNYDFSFTVIISLIIGFLTCFYGYKCKRIVFAIVWFAIGFLLADALLGGMIPDQMVRYLISGGIGLVLGAIGFNLQVLSIFITSGYLAGNFIYSILNFNNTVNIIIAIIVGIIVGILVIKFVKPIFIITTSISGAGIILTQITTLIIGIPAIATAIIQIALIIFGIWYQFSDCRNLE